MERDPVTYEEAEEMFGEAFIGPIELSSISMEMNLSETISAREIPFGREKLEAVKNDYLLIFTPSKFANGESITLNSLRAHFGVDPAVQEPCMYNQDWYMKEDFATETTLDGDWHLIRKNVLEEARAKRPDEIEASLTEGGHFPTAVTATFAFFAYWFLTKGERLWNHDFLWCSDRDHNNDRVYVGRYEDPTGVNKNGFNIHRHLALRPAYSAAPEL